MVPFTACFEVTLFHLPRCPIHLQVFPSFLLVGSSSELLGEAFVFLLQMKREGTNSKSQTN